MNPNEARAVPVELGQHPSASLESAIELVSEAYQAVALAEQRTRDAERYSDDLEQRCSAQVETAKQLAFECAQRAERAEQRAAALVDCLRQICQAVKDGQGQAALPPAALLQLKDGSA